MKQRNGMRSETPMIDSFVKDSKLEDGDYLGLYLQAQRIERELNEAKTLLIKAYVTIDDYPVGGAEEMSAIEAFLKMSHNEIIEKGTE